MLCRWRNSAPLSTDRRCLRDRQGSMLRAGGGHAGEMTVARAWQGPTLPSRPARRFLHVLRPLRPPGWRLQQLAGPAGVPPDPAIPELDDRDHVGPPAGIGSDGLDHLDVAGADQPTRLDGRRVREGSPECSQVVLTADALAEEFAHFLLGHRPDPLVDGPVRLSVRAAVVGGGFMPLPRLGPLSRTGMTPLHQSRWCPTPRPADLPALPASMS